jgi:hypothetical protein
MLRGTRIVVAPGTDRTGASAGKQTKRTHEREGASSDRVDARFSAHALVRHPADVRTILGEEAPVRG